MQAAFNMSSETWAYSVFGEVGDLFDFAKFVRAGNERALVTLVMPAPGAQEIEWVETYYHAGKRTSPDIRTEHLGTAEALRHRLMTIMSEGWCGVAI